jgi:hypothetical protein
MSVQIQNQLMNVKTLRMVERDQFSYTTSTAVSIYGSATRYKKIHFVRPTTQMGLNGSVVVNANTIQTEEEFDNTHTPEIFTK